MDTNDLIEQLAGLDEQIDALPRGSISSKRSTGIPITTGVGMKAKTFCDCLLIFRGVDV